MQPSTAINEVFTMYARVNTFQGKPEDAEAALQDVRTNVLPAVRQLPGNAGFISLIDRSTGKAMGITLWETEEAMRGSEDAAGGIRQRSAEAERSEVVSVERYEVANLALNGQPVVV